MNKPKNKRERQVRRALELSKRNQPAGFKPRRKARRLAARLGEVETPFKSDITEAELQKMKVGDLRNICTSAGIKFTTKDRKADLINKLVDHA